MNGRRVGAAQKTQMYSTVTRKMEMACRSIRSNYIKNLLTGMQKGNIYQIIVRYKYINPEKVELFFNECRNFHFLTSMTYEKVHRIREQLRHSSSKYV